MGRRNKYSIAEEIDVRTGLIKRYARGRSFADIGSMWAVNGLYSFAAEECGASRVVSVDLYQTDEFLSELRARGSVVEFVAGDVLLRETIDRVGLCDVVFCSGVLYHVPNPLALLSQLRLICGEVLILCTAMIPEMPGVRNMAVFYPGLDQGQRKIWSRSDDKQWGLTVPYEPEYGYSNNLWGLSPSCVESMLECAGFRVMERYLGPFRGCFVCRTVGVEFEPMIEAYQEFRRCCDTRRA